MARISTYSTVINSPAATGSQSYTGFGFMPKFVYALYTDQSVAGNDTFSQVGCGFASSATDEMGAYYACRTAINPTEYDTKSQTTKLIETHSNFSAGTTRLEAAVTSFDADGITLNWTKVSTGIRVYIVAVSQAIPNAKVITFTSPTATGTKNVTGVGFQPNTLIILSPQSTGTMPVTEEAGRFGIGFCDNSLGQASMSIFGEDNVATLNTSRSNNSTNAIRCVDAGETVRFSAAVTGYTSDGFDLNFTTTQGTAANFIALCLGGVESKVGSFTQKTSTGSQSLSSLSFQPSHVWCFSDTTTTQNAEATIAQSTLGHFNSVGQAETCQGELDGSAAPQTVRRGNQSTAMYQVLNAGGSTLAQAALTTMDTNGWTLNFSTADANARHIYYLALGDGQRRGGAFHHHP